MNFPDYFKNPKNKGGKEDDLEEEFKKNVGMSMQAYINHHRIEVAKKILAEEDLQDVPVSVVASEVGYPKTSTFISIFKEKEGLPPKEWRKINQK
jgi:AraC-like DNA-binding protein